MLIPFKDICEKYKIATKGVIHVGAHHGEEIQDYYSNGVKHSVWIEANPSVFAVLEKTVAEYPKAFAVNACLSDKVGEVTFNIANNSQSSSILDLAYHKIAHPEVHYTETISLQTTTLDEAMNVVKGKKLSFEFLNADIQGAEMLMLKGAPKTIEKLKYIYLEVSNKPIYEGCALIDEMDAFLAERGFTRVEVLWCGDFGWGDALYIKNTEIK